MNDALLVPKGRLLRARKNRIGQVGPARANKGALVRHGGERRVDAAPQLQEVGLGRRGVHLQLAQPELTAVEHAHRVRGRVGRAEPRAAPHAVGRAVGAHVHVGVRVKHAHLQLHVLGHARKALLLRRGLDDQRPAARRAQSHVLEQVLALLGRRGLDLGQTRIVPQDDAARRAALPRTDRHDLKARECGQQNLCLAREAAYVLQRAVEGRADLKEHRDLIAGAGATACERLGDLNVDRGRSEGGPHDGGTLRIVGLQHGRGQLRAAIQERLGATRIHRVRRAKAMKGVQRANVRFVAAALDLVQRAQQRVDAVADRSGRVLDRRQNRGHWNAAQVGDARGARARIGRMR